MAARPQEKLPAFTPYSPISERDNEGSFNYDNADPPSGCFGRFCFCWPDDDGGSSHNHLLHDGHRDSWPMAKLRSLKEFSELAAGPKWKNFIRRIGKLRNHNKPVGKAAGAAAFQYSPESYALNFAGDGEREEDGTLLHSFSSRYAPHALINDQQRRAAGGGL